MEVNNQSEENAALEKLERQIEAALAPVRKISQDLNRGLMDMAAALAAHVRAHPITGAFKPSK